MCSQGRTYRLSFIPLALCLTAISVGCGSDPAGTEVPDHPGATKTAATERALRRGYDGAPPVVPHESFGSPCTECHNQEGVSVPGVGFSPPSPHEATAGMSAISRCEQCHVSRVAETLFAENRFAGLHQDLRKGRRLNPIAPPVMPHSVFMRENCIACHSGAAAREPIRTTHPERERCSQCHIEQVTTTTFEPSVSGQTEEPIDG